MNDSLEPLRLPPGTDLRAALEALARERGAGFVVAGLGSLKPTRLRLAGAELVMELEGDVELLSLTGSLTREGAHLHASISDVNGQVYGGHLMAGSRVRTTAELLVAWLPGWELRRELDAATGYAELQVRRREP
ncbi:PPC domain-containing DNA-binding protein [Pelomonas sp. SE-A7]|uniref:PPC domain-containing DNA-binding protein n=1 Tax=Pelomonas sp. SE-A7 TaxID=3054953 RepID=UPI00259CFAF8|nr:PPC domain-containing DNA-binding protein [Pelomonas sp. SE-A7]MDM4766517.1 DNA-binding protein [Pelomonas sp. SE-A7]